MKKPNFRILRSSDVEKEGEQMSIRVNTSLIIDDERIEAPSDLARIYNRRVSRFGFGGRALLYSDDKLHAAKLTQYATLVHKLWKVHVSVLDVGCGYGSLVPFLPPCSYYGIDIVPEFVNEAKRRFPHLRFDHRNIQDCVEQYDWVLLLGITGSVPDPENLVKQAWKLARMGLIVDFIDAARYQGYLNRFDIGACVKLFLEQGAGLVETHRTSGFNWVIQVVYRDDAWLLTSGENDKMV